MGEMHINGIVRQTPTPGSTPAGEGAYSRSASPDSSSYYSEQRPSHLSKREQARPPTFFERLFQTESSQDPIPPAASDGEGTLARLRSLDWSIPF